MAHHLRNPFAEERGFVVVALLFLAGCGRGMVGGADGAVAPSSVVHARFSNAVGAEIDDSPLTAMPASCTYYSNGPQLDCGGSDPLGRAVNLTVVHQVAAGTTTPTGAPMPVAPFASLEVIAMTSPSQPAAWSQADGMGSVTITTWEDHHVTLTFQGVMEPTNGDYQSMGTFTVEGDADVYDFTYY